MKQAIQSKDDHNSLKKHSSIVYIMHRNKEKTILKFTIEKAVLQFVKAKV